MKYIFLISVLTVSVLIIFGGIWLLSDSQSPRDSRDLDILTNENLIREVNKARAGAGMKPLVQDEELSRIARERAESDMEEFVGDGEFVVSYRVLSGEEPQQFYSVRKFVDSLWINPDTNAMLRSPGSRIGAWVAYVLRTETSKPVPRISIIVR